MPISMMLAEVFFILCFTNSHPTHCKIALSNRSGMCSNFNSYFYFDRQCALISGP